jgi:hypothetical protein
VAVQSTELDSWIKFQEMNMLAKISGYMDQLVKVVTEIRVQPHNINREERYKLNKARNPTIRLL